jgi:hypothetical protein
MATHETPTPSAAHPKVKKTREASTPASSQLSLNHPELPITIAIKKNKMNGGKKVRHFFDNGNAFA